MPQHLPKNPGANVGISIQKASPLEILIPTASSFGLAGRHQMISRPANWPLRLPKTNPSDALWLPHLRQSTKRQTGPAASSSEGLNHRASIGTASLMRVALEAAL